MDTIVPRTWIQGTPRGFGDNKIASVWLMEMEVALDGYRGRGVRDDPKTTRYEVILEFRIFPNSQKYRGQNLPHGTDLDNLVKQTIDGLAKTNSRSLPPGLQILQSDRAVYRIIATKEHVPSDDETGVWININAL
jgi:hypothetical protein